MSRHIKRHSIQFTIIACDKYDETMVGVPLTVFHIILQILVQTTELLAVKIIYIILSPLNLLKVLTEPNTNYITVYNTSSVNLHYAALRKQRL